MSCFIIAHITSLHEFNIVSGWKVNKPKEEEEEKRYDYSIEKDKDKKKMIHYIFKTI